MTVWFALIVVPVLALIDQSVAYATTTWACAHQSVVAVHAVHAPFLAVAIAGTVLAWKGWRRVSPTVAESETLARRRFVAGLATGASALSVLVILAMWVPAWVLGACIS
jgi:hypothetical protein